MQAQKACRCSPHACTRRRRHPRRPGFGGGRDAGGVGAGVGPDHAAPRPLPPLCPGLCDRRLAGPPPVQLARDPARSRSNAVCSRVASARSLIAFRNHETLLVVAGTTPHGSPGLQIECAGIIRVRGDVSRFAARRPKNQGDNGLDARECSGRTWAHLQFRIGRWHVRLAPGPSISFGRVRS
jgi:hypothetical protein